MTCHGYPNGCTCPRCNTRWRNHNTNGIHHKEIRQFISQHLTPHGWRRIDTVGGGRPVFWHPDHSTDDNHVIVLPSTPSGHAWSRNALAQARRIHPDMRTKHATPRTPAPTAAPVDRAARLTQHAATLGITLTARQAHTLLARHGGLPAARRQLNLIVTAKRRALNREAAIA